MDTKPPRCHRVPCVAAATHIVVADWLGRRWQAESAETGTALPRYCQTHAEARAARLTARVRPQEPSGA